MRATLIGLTVLGLATGLTACGKKVNSADGQVAATEPSSAPVAAAPASPPKRKAGLWQQTITADGRTMVSKICTDETYEKHANMIGSSMAGACDQSTTPAAGGWKIKSSCDMGSAGKSSTEGTITGDFATRLEMKATTTISGAAAPQMNRTTQMTLLSEFLGPCPAGWVAGDMELPGVGKVSTAAAMAKGARDAAAK